MYKVAQASGLRLLLLASETHALQSIQRFDAHRFYLVKRMKISSYHFSVKISPENL
jgi:hypothetical protein